MSKTLLLLVVCALIASAAMGETAIEKLKAKVVAGTAQAPCDKAGPAAPAAPKQFLDIRLPVVVDDYHPPVGGFNPSHIPDKEVDVAARKILREIQAAEAEAKANGDEPQGEDPNVTLTTEEHVALKQLLLDADILIRAAGKLNAENGPVTVAKKAVKAAAAMAKAANVGKGAPGKSTASEATAARTKIAQVGAAQPPTKAAASGATNGRAPLPKVGAPPAKSTASGSTAARGTTPAK